MKPTASLSLSLPHIFPRRTSSKPFYLAGFGPVTYRQKLKEIRKNKRKGKTQRANQLEQLSGRGCPGNGTTGWMDGWRNEWTDERLVNIPRDDWLSLLLLSFFCRRLPSKTLFLVHCTGSGLYVGHSIQTPLNAHWKTRKHTSLGNTKKMWKICGRITKCYV